MRLALIHNVTAFARTDCPFIERVLVAEGMCAFRKEGESGVLGFGRTEAQLVKYRVVGDESLVIIHNVGDLQIVVVSAVLLSVGIIYLVHEYALRCYIHRLGKIE